MGGGSVWTLRLVQVLPRWLNFAAVAAPPVSALGEATLLAMFSVPLPIVYVRPLARLVTVLLTRNDEPNSESFPHCIGRISDTDAGNSA
jgi:hypothetical protein